MNLSRRIGIYIVSLLAHLVIGMSVITIGLFTLVGFYAVEDYIVNKMPMMLQHSIVIAVVAVLTIALMYYSNVVGILFIHGAKNLRAYYKSKKEKANG